MKSIEEAGDIKGKRILLRVDFNVPIRDGKILNDYRIKNVLPTIQSLKDAGAVVIIISHIASENGETLKPVFEYFNDKGHKTVFVEDLLGEKGKEDIQGLSAGEIAICENLRSYKGEEENDPGFAGELASLGDIFVNEAFSASHRTHASIVSLPKLLPSYAGPLFLKELKELSRIFNPDRPFLFILGGAKFETKVPLIKKFLDKADNIFIGGAIANNFFKAKGFNVGTSLVSESEIDVRPLLESKKIVTPTDVEVKSTEGIFVKEPNEVSDEEKILDSGPKTMETLKGFVEEARFIVWNGPLGNYESGFREHTGELASMIAKSDAHSIVGGGDTILAISELNIEERFSFVSTAGGAMIQFAAEGTLPGIEALENSA